MHLQAITTSNQRTGVLTFQRSDNNMLCVFGVFLAFVAMLKYECCLF